MQAHRWRHVVTLGQGVDTPAIDSEPPVWATRVVWTWSVAHALQEAYPCVRYARSARGPSSRMCNVCEVDMVWEAQTEGEVYAERGEHVVGVRCV